MERAFFLSSSPYVFHIMPSQWFSTQFKPEGYIKNVSIMLEQPQTQQNLGPMNVKDIMAAIPHRYPFLLVDHVETLYTGDIIEGHKNVTANEPFFQGHFPGNPIMPGVLIVEALAQLGCIMVKNMPEGEGKLVLFAGIDRIRFRRQVVPGDRLDLFARMLKVKGPLGKAYIKASVLGDVVCEGEILFSMVPESQF